TSTRIELSASDETARPSPPGASLGGAGAEALALGAALVLAGAGFAGPFPSAVGRAAARGSAFVAASERCAAGTRAASDGPSCDVSGSEPAAGAADPASDGARARPLDWRRG